MSLGFLIFKMELNIIPFTDLSGRSPCMCILQHAMKCQLWGASQPGEAIDFPGSPVVKTVLFQCRVTGSIPGWGTKIPHAVSTAKKKHRKAGSRRAGGPGCTLQTLGAPPPVLCLEEQVGRVLVLRARIPALWLRGLGNISPYSAIFPPTETTVPSSLHLSQE